MLSRHRRIYLYIIIGLYLSIKHIAAYTLALYTPTFIHVQKKRIEQALNKCVEEEGTNERNPLT